MERRPKYPEEHLLAAKLKTLGSLRAYEKLFIGSQIKKARIKAGLKQNALAKKLATTQSAVARIEAGKQNCTLDTLITIAYHLGKKLGIRLH